MRKSFDTLAALVIDVREARQLADRMSILEGGRTLQDGTPEAVMSRPRNARVAALVGLRDIHRGIFLKDRPACLRWGSSRSPPPWPAHWPWPEEARCRGGS